MTGCYQLVVKPVGLVSGVLEYALCGLGQGVVAVGSGAVTRVLPRSACARLFLAPTHDAPGLPRTALFIAGGPRPRSALRVRPTGPAREFKSVAHSRQAPAVGAVDVRITQGAVVVAGHQNV